MNSKISSFPDKPSILMFSAGVDSTVLLHLLKTSIKSPIEAVFLDVGQLSADRQFEIGHKVCSSLGIPLLRIELQGYKMLTAGYNGPPYTRVAEDPESQPLALILFARAAVTGASVVYRAMTMTDFGSLDAKQVFVESAKAIVEAAKLAFNRRDFEYSLPLLDSNIYAADLVRQAHDRGWDLANTWSCQWGFLYHCGKCWSCQKRKQSFEAVGMADPTTYVDYPGTDVSRTLGPITSP